MDSPEAQSALSLRPALRVGWIFPSQGRAWRGSMPFLAPVVDGVVLHESVPGLEEGQLPSLLQPDFGDQTLMRAVGKLLGTTAPDYPDGRVGLYPCFCGDLWCPAVGVRITVEADSVTWSDWAWSAMGQEAEPLPQLPVLRFSRQEYEQALAQAPVLMAEVPDWERPPARTLWPWQWGWSLSDEPHFPGGKRAQGSWAPFRAAVRAAFQAVDPAGLGEGGVWFPDTTYDPEADQAAVWLSRRTSVEQVVERTAGTMAKTWGITVSTDARTRLLQGLKTIDRHLIP